MKFIKFSKSVFNTRFIKQVEPFDGKKKNEHAIFLHIHGDDIYSRELFSSSQERDNRLNEIVNELNVNRGTGFLSVVPAKK